MPDNGNHIEIRRECVLMRTRVAWIPFNMNTIPDYLFVMQRIFEFVRFGRDFFFYFKLWRWQGSSDAISWLIFNWIHWMCGLVHHSPAFHLFCWLNPSGSHWMQFQTITPLHLTRFRKLDIFELFRWSKLMCAISKPCTLHSEFIYAQQFCLHLKKKSKAHYNV